MRMRRVLPVVALLLAVVATPASGDVGSRKQQVDARLEAVQAKIARAEQRERDLAAEIASVNSEIRGLATQVGVVSTRLAPLERDLALHKEKLDRLNELFRVQTDRFEFYRHEYEVLLDRLGNRLIDLYEGGEPNSLEVLLSAKTFTDLISQAEYVDAIGTQDKQIADQVGTAKHRVHRQREHHEALPRPRRRRDEDDRDQGRPGASAARSASREREPPGLCARLEAREPAQRQGEQAGISERGRRARAGERLARRPDRVGAVEPLLFTAGRRDAVGLGLHLAGQRPGDERIRERWGRMHEGIDIGVGYGTPIHAAASGRVIYAGWMEGYGNLVAIDHGRGISTAYGHQSSVAVSNGETVSQGQVIGYVGCTGHCFGPHLHFEVRINGAPVDPLGYL